MWAHLEQTIAYLVYEKFFDDNDLYNWTNRTNFSSLDLPVIWIKTEHGKLIIFAELDCKLFH